MAKKGFLSWLGLGRQSDTAPSSTESVVVDVDRSSHSTTETVEQPIIESPVVATEAELGDAVLEA